MPERRSTAGPGCAPSPGRGDLRRRRRPAPSSTRGDGDDAVDVRNGTSDSVWCGSGPRLRHRRGARLPGPRLRAGRLRAGRLGRPDRAPHRRRSLGARSPARPGRGSTAASCPDVLYLVRRYHVRITRATAPSATSPSASIRSGWPSTSAGRRRHAGTPCPGSPAGPSRARTTRGAPFRWVGWNGDFNHGHPSVCKPRLGCAPHLHLSWSHSPTAPRHIARTVRVFEVRLGA